MRPTPIDRGLSLQSFKRLELFTKRTEIDIQDIFIFKNSELFQDFNLECPFEVFTSVTTKNPKVLSNGGDLLRTGSMKPKAIDIFEFEDQREYLAAVLKDRKQSRSTQSLRQLAKRAGFRSPAILSMVLNGKRALSAGAAEKIAKALSLVGRRKRYLIELSKLDRAKTELEKTRAREELYRLKAAADENLMDLRHYRCLSVWYYPVIYVLVGQSDFRNDPEWIAGRLGSEVSAEQVKEALKDMEETGMIKKNKNGWIQSQGALSTRDDIKDAAVYAYHSQMLDRAKKSLELPLDQREFNGVTVCIPEDKIGLVKERVRKFRKELNEYLSQFTEASEVYQFNIQIFPHTKKESKK